MKKQLFVLLATVALSMVALAQSGETVYVGSGTDGSTNFRSPSQPNFNYHYAQNLYLASEVGTSGTITHIAWMPSASFGAERTWRVLLGETTMSALGSDSYVPFADLTEVFQGTVVAVAGGQWLDIELDVPFNYSGSNNLVVAVEDQTATAGSWIHWYSTIGTSQVRQVRWSSSNNAVTAENPPASGGQADPWLPNLRLVVEQGVADVCFSPAALTASNVTDQSVTITVTEHATNPAGSYTLQYKRAAASWDDDVTELNLTGSSLVQQISGLDPNTAYTFRVRSECGSRYSAWRLLSVTTACGTIGTLPWTEGFEDDVLGAVPGCWEVVTPMTGSTYLAAYGSFTHSGSMCLRFNHSPSSGSIVMLPRFEADISTLSMNFWHRPESVSNSGSGTLAVGYVTDSTGTFVPVRSWAYNDFTSATYREESEITFADAPAGSRIAFRHTASGSDWYWHVDDITVVAAPSCARPVVSVSNVSATEASVTLTDTGNVNHYLLRWTNGSTTDSAEVTDSTYTLSGLTPDTTYTLSAVTLCTDGTVTSAVTVSFATPCVGLTEYDLPLTQDFDDLAANHTFDVPCWSTLNYYSGNYPYPSTSYAHSGTKSLYFYPGYSYQPQYLISPAIEDIRGLFVSFYYQAYENSTLNVGYMTDPADTSTFVSLYSRAAGNGLGADNWEYVEQLMAAAPAAAHHIAVRVGVSSMVGGPAYLDDLTIAVAPTCARPGGVEVVGLGETFATIAIADPTHNNNYGVALLSAGDTVWVATATDTAFLLDNLTANMAYTVQVVSNCTDGTVTTPVSCSFRTACGSIGSLPWEEGFESSPAYETPSCWTHLTPGSSTFNVCQVYGYPAHSGSKCLRFCYTNGRNVVTLPTFADDISGMELSFWHRPQSISEPSCGTLQVGYMTDPADTASFVVTASFSYSDFSEAEYRMDEATFMGAPAGSCIAFRHIATGSYGWFWHVDDINVHTAPDCFHPNSVSVDSVGQTWAHVTIHNPAGAGGYSVVLLADGDTVANISLSDTTLTLDSLSVNTAYTAQVRTVCSDGSLTSPVSASFRTACGVIANLPWHESFADYATYDNGGSVPCWTFHRGDGTLYVTGSGANGSANSLYFHSSSHEPMVAVMPKFEAGLHTLMLKFYMYSYSATGSIEVGYVTDPADASTFIPVVSHTVGTDYAWFDFETFFPNVGEGYIAFRYTGGSSGVMIDDIQVGPIPDCVHPQGITVGNLTASSADITIVDVTEANNYRLVIGTGTDTISLTQATYTATGLQANTAYNVSVLTVCGDSSYTRSVGTTFTTPCVGIDSLPWHEGFETCFGPSSSALSFPCWKIYSTHVGSGYYGSYFPYVSDYSGDAQEGSRSLCFNAQSGAVPQMVILPPFDTTLSSLLLSFWLRSPSPSSAIEVGVVSNPDDHGTFSPVRTFSPGLANVYEEAECTFDSVAGGFIAFRFMGAGPLYIDNLTIDLLPACRRPEGIVVSGVTDSSATASVIDPSGAGSYRVYLMANDSIADSAIVADTSCTFGHLAPSSNYRVVAVAICTDGSMSSAATAAFSTLPAPVTYTVSTTSADTSMGSATVNPSGIVDEGTSVTFTATPADGYEFVGWTDTAGNSVSSANPYTVAVVADLALIANFQAQPGPQPATYTLTVTCDPSMGTVTGGGRFIEDTTVTITASGLPGYHFVEWAGDHVTDSVRRVTITSDTTFTALFEANPVIGIGDVALADVALCPNPATAEVTLTGLAGSACVTFIDPSGRAVGEWRVKNGECKLDVSGLPRGAYFVRIATDDAIAVRKLIVK